MGGRRSRYGTDFYISIGLEWDDDHHIQSRHDDRSRLARSRVSAAQPRNVLSFVVRVVRAARRGGEPTGGEREGRRGGTTKKRGGAKGSSEGESAHGCVAPWGRCGLWAPV